MSELVAGAETDLRVAEALGYPAWIDDGQCWVGAEIHLDGDGPFGGPLVGQKFSASFSTDLNHAFAAAEEAGLFHSFYMAMHCDELGPSYGWSISEEFEDGHPWRKEIANEKTPALAICAAILKGADND